MVEQQSATTASGRCRFEALDAARGVCALLVAFYHAPIHYALKDVPALDNLQFCVDVFFVLSGFVLLHGYGDRLSSVAEGWRFALARFGRLWPLHVVTLAVLVALEAGRMAYLAHDASASLMASPFGHTHTPAELLENLVFLQAFGLNGEVSWNFPSWSIAVEFYASLVLALVVLVCGPRRAWVFAALAALAGVALHHVSPRTLFVIEDWSILRCLFDLFAGCLAYRVRESLRGCAGTPTLLECAALAGVAAFMAFVPAGSWRFAAPALFGIAIVVFSCERGLVSRAARTLVPQRLGLWSFSIYLVHVPVYEIVQTGVHWIDRHAGTRFVVPQGGGEWLDFGSSGANLAVTLGLLALVVVPLAALSHAAIERPGIALFKRLGRVLRPVWGHAPPRSGAVARARAPSRWSDAPQAGGRV